MEIQVAQQNLRKMLDEAKLNDWTVTAPSPAKSYTVKGTPARKQLTLAQPWVERMTDTQFEAEMSSMILKIERHLSGLSTPNLGRRKYNAVCPVHGVVGGWGRMPGGDLYTCSRCRKEGKGRTPLNIVEAATGKVVRTSTVVAEPLTDEIKARFVNLTCELSPENLTCDGELSPSRVAVRRRELMNEWHSLERKIGRTVTEDQAWKWNEDPEVSAIGEVLASEDPLGDEGVTL